jgi:hypothetical protein
VGEAHIASSSLNFIREYSSGKEITVQFLTLRDDYPVLLNGPVTAITLV